MFFVGLPSDITPIDARSLGVYAPRSRVSSRGISRYCPSSVLLTVRGALDLKLSRNQKRQSRDSADQRSVLDRKR